jgi:hypothetical protein
MINGLRLGRKAISILAVGIAFLLLSSLQESHSQTPVPDSCRDPLAQTETLLC